jgi:hypothetical protein
MTLNLSRVLASRGISPGANYQWTIFDPATLRNAPVDVKVGRREVVRLTEGIVPAFRVDMTFQGLQTTSWVTDTGDVVKEESPLGLVTVRETAERAQGMGIPGRVQADLLRMSAVVPEKPLRIDDARDVKRLRIRLEGVDFEDPDLSGVGQTTMQARSRFRMPRSCAPARQIQTRGGTHSLRRSSKATPRRFAQRPSVRFAASRATARGSSSSLAM